MSDRILMLSLFLLAVILPVAGVTWIGLRYNWIEWLMPPDIKHTTIQGPVRPDLDMNQYDHYFLAPARRRMAHQRAAASTE
jgi:hypothetical protein